MAKIETAEPATEDKRAVLQAAFDERDRLLTQMKPDREAIKTHDAKILDLVHGYDHPEEFDPAAEPVLACLSLQAKSRNPFAVRLLLQPRERITLFQTPKGEQQMAPQHVTINGVAMIVPRGKRCQVPALVAEILDQGEIR